MYQAFSQCGRLAFRSLVVLLIAVSSARAVDGVVELNQAKILASGGFPYTITQPGSYRLTGNLDVSGLPNPHNVTAIIVGARNVTLDLNGFTIRGPLTCSLGTSSGASLTCSTTGGGGHGIVVVSPAFDATVVRNGIIRGMGGGAIYLQNGSRHVIENVTAIENGADAFTIRDGRVNHVVAINNHGIGVSAATAVVTDAYVNGNLDIGINVSGHGLVSGSVTSFNGSFGLNLAPAVGYSNVVAISNNGGAGAVQINSGVSLFGNLCNHSGTSCP
jgi:hypothetical protein